MLDMFGVAWEEFEKGTSPIPVGHRPNHCKFVLLQRTITQGTGFPPKFFSVVAQSSGNLYHNATLSRQDTLITHGGGEIYNAYRRGFEALFSGVAPYSVTHASDGQTGVFFVPSRRAVDNLSSLCEPAGCCDDDNCCACTTDCSFENPFSWHLSRLSEDPPPWIFLAVGHAVPCCDLSQEIIRHLYKFHVSGAYVRVAVGNAYASFKAEMDKMGESLGVSPIPTVLRNIHNKYLVTLGKTLVSYDADNPQDQSKWSYATRFFVLTGSLNIGKWEMADSVLMCDTSFFGGSTWAEYRDDFDSLWEGD
ncbi:MAG: hypothetical protein H6711_25040 [Myxococcales bacterium]|nr:hypothetical protein [Myxococcales bacterium]